MFNMHEAHLLHTSNIPQTKKDYILSKHADQDFDRKETMIFPRITHNCRCPEICKFEWKIFRPDSGNFSVAVISSCHEFLVLELVDRHDNLVSGVHNVQLCLVDEKLLTQYGPVRCSDDVNSVLVPHQTCSWCMQQPDSFSQTCNNPECVARTPHLLLQNDDEEGVQITCQVINGRLLLDRLYIGNSCKSEKRKQLTPRVLRLMAIIDIDDCFQTTITKSFRVPTNRSKTQRDRNLKQTISKLTGIPPRKMRNRRVPQEEPPAKRRATLPPPEGNGFRDEVGSSIIRGGAGDFQTGAGSYQHNRRPLDRNSFVIANSRMRMLPPLPLSTTSLLTSRHIYSPLNAGPPGPNIPPNSSILQGYQKQRKYFSDPLPLTRRQIMAGEWGGQGQGQGQGQDQGQNNVFPPNYPGRDQKDFEFNRMTPQFPSQQQEEMFDAIQRRKFFEKRQSSENFQQKFHPVQRRFEFPPNISYQPNKGHQDDMYGPHQEHPGGGFRDRDRDREQQISFHPFRGYKSAPLSYSPRNPFAPGNNSTTFIQENSRFIEREIQNNANNTNNFNNHPHPFNVSAQLPPLQNNQQNQKEHVIQIKSDEKQNPVKNYLAVLNENTMGSEEEMFKLLQIVESYSKKIPVIDKIGDELMFKPNLVQPTIQFLVMSSSETQDFAQLLEKVLTTLQGAKI